MAQTMSKQERAEALAATAHSWPHVTVRGMRQAWAVPSQSEAGKYHLTSRVSCDCVAWQHGRMCAHVLAVRIVAARQTPGYQRAAARWSAPFDRTQSVAALAAKYEQIYGSEAA